MSNTVSSASEPRRIVIRILQRWERGGDFARDLVDAHLRRANLAPRDRSSVAAAVYGVIRARGKLDWLIDSASSRRKPSSGSAVRQILRLALFHLFEESPPRAGYAVVHQAGELGKEFLTGRESAFVNAVLRLVSQDGFVPSWPPAGRSAEHLAVIYSHPAWLVKRWLRRWDPGGVEKICRAGNCPPPVFIRVNLLRSDPAILREELRKAGRDFIPVDGRDNIGELKPANALFELESFRRGWFQVQDISTLVAVDLLDPRPGETVVDFCSAPGGKASYAAEKMLNRGVLIAAERNHEKLGFVRENFSRLGINCARYLVSDLTSAAVQEESADAVLLDVPCSNTGVLRRRVDARWRLRAADIRRLAEQAGRMIAAAAPVLKKGGRLVYSTCSIEPEENRMAVDSFLKGRAGFRLAGEASTLPGEGRGDGYYAALITRE